MKNIKILPAFIVDDDPFWTAILKQILTELGFTKIHTFEDGVDCLNHIHLNPGLIFLDYQMENSNGLEILQEVKNYFPGIEVVFCTALESLEVAIAAIEHGSVEYLLKSNVTEELVKDIVDNFQSAKLA
ncbi:response regulator [Algoriphagus winogradskyi]|uniref:Response regulator receiver domain-containing protein n=1 Tax=Algoriphagus winogradskyi TaxID=237017 RepID=A0ABY1NFG0_9BACT|nr:response regulator [Algoriphagus winogradskyi]SMP08268.1 Response regulator receiver domain-containing protein [Algoriphagus winogradskyi]